MSKQARIHSFFRPASQVDEEENAMSLAQFAAREKKLLQRAKHENESEQRSLQHHLSVKRRDQKADAAVAAAAANNTRVRIVEGEQSISRMEPYSSLEEGVNVNVELLEPTSAPSTMTSHLEGDRIRDTKPLPNDHQKQRRSILDHLRLRSTHGGKARFTEQQAPGLLLPEWQPCPWLVLQAKNPQFMAFSHDGVLLAVACENNILIFDWDTVIASDMKGRLDRQKDMLSPILSFRVPFLVSHLLWNMDDHLLVSYRGAAEIHIFNMVQIAENDGTFVSSSVTAAACMKCRPSNHMSQSRTPNCVTFLGLHHICAVYPCGHVCLWKSNLVRGVLVWCWKYNQNVSCVRPLSDNWILFGATGGDFTIVDWKTCRRKSFASDKTPTIVTTYVTPSLFPNYRDIVSPRDLAVQSMTLDMTRTTEVQHLPSSCRLSWITAGGWALTMTLSPQNSKGRSNMMEILASPPILKTKTCDGEHVPSAVPKFSTTSTPTLCSTDTYVWQTVPQTTIILPPHDFHRVCQDRQVLRSNKITLSCIDGRSIPMKQQPTALVVHPSREWMVVGTQSKTIILNARSNVKHMTFQSTE